MSGKINVVVVFFKVVGLFIAQRNLGKSTSIWILMERVFFFFLIPFFLSFFSNFLKVMTGLNAIKNHNKILTSFHQNGDLPFLDLGQCLVSTNYLMVSLHSLASPAFAFLLFPCL